MADDHEDSLDAYSCALASYELRRCRSLTPGDVLDLT